MQETLLSLVQSSNHTNRTQKHVPIKYIPVLFNLQNKGTNLYNNNNNLNVKTNKN
ncbi:hypothetical protein Hanom_Chr15g01394261 [Helianthus anomalus]